MSTLLFLHTESSLPKCGTRLQLRRQRRRSAEIKRRLLGSSAHGACSHCRHGTSSTVAASPSALTSRGKGKGPPSTPPTCPRDCALIRTSEQTHLRISLGPTRASVRVSRKAGKLDLLFPWCLLPLRLSWRSRAWPRRPPRLSCLITAVAVVLPPVFIRRQRRRSRRRSRSYRSGMFPLTVLPLLRLCL